MAEIKHVEHINVKLPSDVKMGVPVKVVKEKFTGIKRFPELKPNSPGELVFALLYSCFQKQGFVAEGPLEDIFFGFEQPPNGIPRATTAAGLIQLRKAGYLYYSTPEGVALTDDTLLKTGKDKVWMRYSKKLLNLLK